MNYQHCVILFYTQSSAFRAEKVTREAGIECKLIPIPRNMSSDCGVALQVYEPFADEVRSILESSGVEIAGIHVTHP